MIDKKYLINVSDFHPELLPKPTPKIDLLNDKAETLDELEIITIECELFNIIKPQGE